MSTVVTCPQCQTRMDLPNELADQPVQCHRCLSIFERGRTAPSMAIQAGAAPLSKPHHESANGGGTHPKPHHESANGPGRESPPHREARAPFPIVPILILLLGILFIVLIGSVGFNIWFIVTPEHGFRANPQLQRAEALAQQQRVIAEQAVKAAEIDKNQAKLVQAQQAKQIDELKRQRDEALQKIETLESRLKNGNR